jgi:hypothetical protein
VVVLIYISSLLCVCGHLAEIYFIRTVASLLVFTAELPASLKIAYEESLGYALS